MEVKHLTPIHVVESIEPALPFWKALGFEIRVEVPHGPALGFVLLGRGASQVMLQTRASVKADVGDTITAGSVLYLDVDDVDAALRAVPDATIVVPRRKTFYGAEEVFVQDGAGNVVGFAMQSS
jgi:uncharacterized glyoxalase superfamily protein PhnB